MRAGELFRRGKTQAEVAAALGVSREAASQWYRAWSKAHLSIDPDSELIDEVVATPANTPDRDAVGALLAPVADLDDKPVVLGDSAYADGQTREELARAGFELVSRYPPVRNSTGGFTKDRFTVDLTDLEAVSEPGAITESTKRSQPSD